MVLHRQSIKSIPSLTKEIARKAFPKGNIYMTLRDKLGSFYDDEDFAELYSDPPSARQNVILRNSGTLSS